MVNDEEAPERIPFKNMSTTTQSFYEAAYIVSNISFVIAFCSIPLWILFFGFIWPAKTGKSL